jgi:hypothetical protein
VSTPAPTGSGASPSFAPKVEFPSGANPYFIETADLNGDGRPDLAVTNNGGNSVSVFLNTTAPGAPVPSFAARADFSVAGGYPQGLAIGDLNGDGKPDIVVVSDVVQLVAVLMNTTVAGTLTPTFEAEASFSTGPQPAAVALGDVNGDGRLDLVVGNLASNTVSVLINTTESGALVPTFADKVDFATGPYPSSIAIGDINGDGKLDLAVTAAYSGTVSVILNTTAVGAEAPSFAARVDFPTGMNPNSVAIADINRDGLPDLLIANASSCNRVSVLLSTTPAGAALPSFAPKIDFGTGPSPISLRAGDVDGNGTLDIVIADYSGNSASVLVNHTATGAASPSFGGPFDFPVGVNPTSIVVADFNGDGRLDLAVAKINAVSIAVLLAQ